MESFNKLAVSFFIFVLVSPFLIILVWSGGVEWGEGGATSGLLFRSFIQSFLSALFSVFLGYIGAIGLSALKIRSRYIYFIALLPQGLPPLFLIIGSMRFFSEYPFGLPAVVYLHAFINIGIIAVWLDSDIRGKLSFMSKAAYLEGCSKWMFWWKTLPVLKNNLLMCFIFVFALSLSSFSIPLMVGGMQSWSLEIGIYKAIFNYGNWKYAMGLSCIQIFILFFMTLFLRDKKNILFLKEKENVNFHGVRIFTLFLFVAPVLILSGLWTNWKLGIFQLRSAFDSFYPLLEMGMSSLFIGLAVGIGLWVLFSATLFYQNNKTLEKFLLGFISPSGAIIGFSLIIIGYFYEMGVLALGLILAFFTTLYRLGLINRMDSIRNQIRVAELLGASRLHIFKSIQWPQIAASIGFLSGLGAFWSVGEFAVTGMYLRSHKTLSLLAESLAASYRLEAATIVLLFIFVIGVGLFFTFWRMGSDLGQKS